MNRRRAAALAAVALCGLLLSLLIPKSVVKQPDTTCDPTVAVATWLYEKGFTPDSYELSLTGFDPEKGTEAWEAGSDAFASQPILNLDQLNTLLQAKHGREGRAAHIIANRLEGREVTPVAIMFNSRVNIEGNLGVNSGQVVNLGTRKSHKGDIVWVFVDQTNCQVVGGLVVRGGCGNPGKNVVPPQPPGPPPPPPPPPPPGPTETPTPTPTKPTETPTPTPTPCPPGQNVNVNGACVEPKPTNPSAYPHPSGKPVVPPVTTPPEAAPPVVATQVPGGNGVVDSPTKAPGAQTGVTAPGAIPAPTSPPASTPPNEGGSNNGGVSGF